MASRISAESFVAVRKEARRSPAWLANGAPDITRRDLADLVAEVTYLRAALARVTDDSAVEVGARAAYDQAFLKHAPEDVDRWDDLAADNDPAAESWREVARAVIRAVSAGEQEPIVVKPYVVPGNHEDWCHVNGCDAAPHCTCGAADEQEVRAMTDDPRMEAVQTGHPPVALLACTVCGVLAWDFDKHYAHAHSDEGCGHPNHGATDHVCAPFRAADEKEAGR